MKINYRKLGLLMMAESPKIKDDRFSNDLARVGEDLTLVGTSYFRIKSFKELSSDHIKTMKEAIVYFKNSNKLQQVMVDNK